MIVRASTDLDRDAIRDVHLAAFDASENRRVAKLATDLLGRDCTPRPLSLVAEIDGAVVGHVAFSPVILPGDSDSRGFILAPLGVRPDFQGRGAGSALVDAGIRQLTEDGIDILFVYGDPAYYGRFGFSAEAAPDLAAPCPLQFEFGWQALLLKPRNPGVSGGRIACVGPLGDPALW